MRHSVLSTIQEFFMSSTKHDINHRSNSKEPINIRHNSQDQTTNDK